MVGDFRLSLAISARAQNVPYISVVNGVWSPNSEVPFITPDHPAMRYLPASLVDLVARPFVPLAFYAHARAFRAQRTRMGIDDPFLSLRRAYTESAGTLYPDIPTLAPVHRLPAGHHYLGPVLWQPPITPPSFWHQPVIGPLVYVNIGSSGDASTLGAIAQGLGSLPVTVYLATAGKATAVDFPQNFRVADYLPGQESATGADLVIGNGGSGTIYQAVAAGVPSDQHCQQWRPISVRQGPRTKWGGHLVARYRTVGQETE